MTGGREDRVEDAALMAALARWARAPVATPAGESAAVARIVTHGDDLASTAALPARPTRRRRWPLMAGAAMAASVALVMLARPAGGPTGPAPAVAETGLPEASFVLLHTPMDEEILF